MFHQSFIEYIETSGNLSLLPPAIAIALDMPSKGSSQCSGGTQFGTGGEPSPLYRSLRSQRPRSEDGPGYDSSDNHGATGGNWAFSDGHVDFVPQTLVPAGTSSGEINKIVLDIFNTIARIRPGSIGGTSTVQTVD